MTRRTLAPDLVEGFGDAAARVTTAALQAAHDTLAALDPPGGAILVPSPVGEGYWLDRPVWLDGGNVTLRGEGRDVPGLRLKHGGPGLIFGLARRPRGIALTPEHRVPLGPLLDGTPGGDRWAFRTMGDAHLSEQSGPLAFGSGDAWGDTASLTIDLIVDLARYDPVGGNPAADLFGMSDLRGRPSPFHAALTGDDVEFAATFSDGLSRSWRFTGERGRLNRWAIQLGPAGLLAGVGGVQVAVRPGPGNKPLKPGATLARNEGWPFGLGARDKTMPGCGVPADLTFCGLALTAGARYADDGPGRPLRLLDGRATTDRVRCFDDGARTIASLELSEPPAALGDRCEPVRSGRAGENRRGWALLLTNGIAGGPGGGGVEELHVRSDSRFGMCVGLGPAIGTRFKGVQFRGGAHGLGALLSGATYDGSVEDAVLSGADSGLYAFMMTAPLKNVTIAGGGRCGVRAPLCALTVSGGLKIAGDSPAECGIKGSGYLVADSLLIDYEGGPFPTKALVQWGTVDQPIGGILDVRSFVAGTMGPQAVAFDLVDTEGKRGTATIGATCLYGDNYPAVVRNTQGWGVTFGRAGLPPKTQQQVVKANQPTGAN